MDFSHFLIQSFEAEQKEHQLLRSKHEIVTEKFEKMKVVEISLSDENSSLVQSKSELEAKVER